MATATASQSTSTTKPVAQPAQGISEGRSLYRLSLDQYHRIAELGLITEDEPVELLDGLLVTKMTKGDPHICSVRLIAESLRDRVPQGFMVTKEDPIALPGGPWGGDSEPGPDVAVVRGSIRDYAQRKPGPADLPLVIEVADSSVADDRDKLTRYAWAGIPQAWLVNLLHRNIEVYTDPTGPDDDPRHATVRTFTEKQDVPFILNGHDCGTFTVGDLLP